MSRLIAWEAGAPERRFTVGGSAKSVARCHRTVLAYWKFESVFLHQRDAMGRAARLPTKESRGKEAGW